MLIAEARITLNFGTSGELPEPPRITWGESFVCTVEVVDDKGRVTDRRAGRIPTEVNERLVGLLREKVHLPGVELFIETVKEHRFVLVLRAEGLASDLNESDTQQLGMEPFLVDRL